MHTKEDIIKNQERSRELQARMRLMNEEFRAEYDPVALEKARLDRECEAACEELGFESLAEFLASERKRSAEDRVAERAKKRSQRFKSD